MGRPVTRPARGLNQKPSMFASLRLPSFRVFIIGQFVAFTGSWVQRVGQDWLVLSLTGSVTAVGITSGLQSLPIMVLAPIGGLLADRYPKRQVLLCAQVVAAAVAAILAVVTFTGVVQVWYVYLAALALGIELSIENPVRYAFVNELVGPTLLRNAVSIHSSAIQLAGLVGPAISGVLLSTLGFGWAFALNALSYSASITALVRLRHSDPTRVRPSIGDPARLRGGLSYVLARPGILWPIVLIGVCGMFTINVTTTLASYAKTVFHSGAGGYSLLSSILASGSLIGALISARISRNDTRTVFTTAASMAVLFMLAPLAPSRGSFCLALIGLGVAFTLYTTSTNVTLQLAAEDAVRGRVIGVYSVVYFGGGALGGPLVGWLDSQFGPRVGMALSGMITAIATVLVAMKVARNARLARRMAMGPAGDMVVG